MLTTRSVHTSTIHQRHHTHNHRNFISHGVVPSRPHVPYSVSLTVSVFAKKDHREHKNDENHRDVPSDLQAYIRREEFLLAELAAARSQVDKLLDQQQVLIGMIAKLTGLTGRDTGLATGAVPVLPVEAPGSSAPSPAPPAVQTTPSSYAAVSAAVRAVSSPASSSPDVPAPISLAELFKTAAATAAATAPHPATAAAAASVAAAFAAVDNGDILAIENVLSVGRPAASPSAGVPSAPQTAAPPVSQQPPMVFDTLGGFVATGTLTAASPTSSGSSSAAAAEAAAPEPVEVAKAAPTDAPPDLVQGDDDIFWLSKLHAALEGRGFFPGYDDMENWFFGETTSDAVLAFQASERLPETGVVDRATWTALLGADEANELYGRVSTSTAAAAAPASSTASSSSSAEGAAAAAPPTSSAAARGLSSEGGSKAPRDLTKWPVLMEGDGGREVHALQVGLTNSGFYCGEDDMRWWQFGETTLTALKFFQSCNGAPESGVCDERCWRVLLGEAASPPDLYDLRLNVNSDDETGYDDDMDGVSDGRVWLLGEQRWEKRST